MLHCCDDPGDSVNVCYDFMIMYPFPPLIHVFRGCVSLFPFFITLLSHEFLYMSEETLFHYILFLFIYSVYLPIYLRIHFILFILFILSIYFWLNARLSLTN